MLLERILQVFFRKYWAEYKKQEHGHNYLYTKSHSVTSKRLLVIITLNNQDGVEPASQFA